MIAIVPINSSVSCSSVSRSSAASALPPGLNGFASTLAAAQSSQSSRENDSAEDGLPEYGSQAIVSPENGPVETDSLPSNSFRSEASPPTPSYGSAATSAKIPASANAQPPVTNSTSKKMASANLTASMPSLSAPTFTVAHTPQLPVVVTPSDAQPPNTNEGRNLPFDSSLSLSAEVGSQDAVSAAPSTPLPLHSSGSAPESVLGNTSPNEDATNYGAPGQLGSVQQPAAGGWFTAAGAEVETQSIAPRVVTEAPRPSIVSVQSSIQISIQASIQTGNSVSSESATVAENLPGLSSSDSTGAISSNMHFGSMVSPRGTSVSATLTTSSASTTTLDATTMDNTNPVLPAQGATLAAEMHAPLNPDAGSSTTPAISAQGSASEQSELSAQDADEVSESGGANSSKEAVAILSTLAGAAAPASMAAAKTSPQFPAQLASAVAPMAHAAGGSSPSGSAAAAPTAALRLQSAPAEISATQSSASAAQTPFSVFFSDAAAATDSAASVLPKMILPASFLGAGFHLSQASGSSGAGPTAQASSSHGGTKQNAAPQIAGSSAKESTSENGNTSMSQAAHTSVDPSANPDPGAAEPAAAVAPAPPVPTQANLPGSGQAASVANSAPQMPAQPAASTASNAPATIVPSAIAASVPEASVPQVLGAVQAAQLLNRAGQSEMRIGLNTTAFGSVEVRTTVRTSDVGLVIGSEKGDLHTLLANELPAVANILQQQNLRLNSVSFMQGFASSNNASGGGNPQQRAFVPMQAPADPASAEGASEDYSDISPSAAWSGSGNFSILA